MSTEPRQPPGTRGTIFIECQYHSDTPSEFLVSFGGTKDGVGAFYLGRATGFDPLTSLLRKLRLSSSVVRTALRVLMAEPRHQIPDVTLTLDTIRELGL
jgi:hypothetical protein